MLLINEEEQIKRLVDILSYKKIICQKKLNGIEKRKKIVTMLSKYPSNPIRCICDLGDVELENILKEFLDVEYDFEDIKIKKYWLNEGINNYALKSSNQYIQSAKLFFELLDKIQIYLDMTNDIESEKENILSELNLVVSLRDLLINNELVTNFEDYYPILKVSKTVSEEYIYSFLVALAHNNTNGNYINKNIDIDKEIKNELTTLIEKLINAKREDLKKNNFRQKKIDSLKNIVNIIENNYDKLLEIYPDKIQNVMTDLWNEKDIKYYIDKLAVPYALIKGKNRGLNIDATEEDLSIISKFIQVLNNKYEELNIEKRVEYSTDKDEDVITLNNILTKLKLSSKSLFNVEEFIFIIDILKNDNRNFEYILSVINMLNILNLKKNIKSADTNEIEKLNIEDDVEKGKKNNDKIKKVELLFTKHGLNFAAFEESLIDKLVSSTSLKKIQQMIEYIDSSKELSFLKDYTLPLGNNSISKEIQQIKCSQFCSILVYSTKEILDNLIKISKEDKLDLYDIFSIPKVFSNRNNDQLNGTYENFVVNEKFIKEKYPEILHEIINRSPFILGTDSSLFRKNIELTEAYKMSIVKDSKGLFPSPIALTSKNFEYYMDRYIEAQEYEYIECYRYQLETNTQATLRIKYLELKNIDINKKEYLDVNSYFNPDIEKYLKGISLENVALAINEPLIKWLDSINEEKDLNKKEIRYIIKGIHISRLKVLKYFSTLLINKYVDKYEGLLYSLVHDSYLTDKEFEELKNIVYDREED